MKKYILLFLASFCGVKNYAQISSVGMSNEFKGLETIGKMQLNGIQTYSSGSVQGSQFFNETWSTGSVLGKNKIEVSNNYLFLFDKVRQELFIKEKDGKEIVLVDKSQIISFTLNTDKPHFFYNASYYDSTMSGNFVEVLVQNDKYSLLKSIKTDFVKANFGDLQRVKDGDVEDKFVDHFDYYIYANNKMQKINLNESAIRKVMKSEKNKVDDYFSLHSNNEIDENFLVNLINTINAL